MDILLILLGIAALALGGDWLVRGAVTIAGCLAISPLVIGLTLVGFGTSTPELFTSIDAALAGAPGIAVGNVVGSNVANILLIIGLCALIRPFAVCRDAVRRDAVMLVLATLACFACVMAGFIDRLMGAALLAGIILYVGVTLYAERRRQSAAAQTYAAEADLVTPAGSWKQALLLFATGLVLTITGAKLLVTGAISLAETAGISQTVIGLTIVAVGTSLPELVTSLMAARRGQTDIALGNIVGSNIFNALGILGITALVQPLTVPAPIAGFHIWVMLAATAALIAAAMTGRRMSRIEGGGMLLGYTAYIGVLATHAT